MQNGLEAKCLEPGKCLGRPMGGPSLGSPASKGGLLVRSMTED